MATKLSRKDVPADWHSELALSAEPEAQDRVGKRNSVERQRRVAQLRELVASGAYKVNLQQLAAALIRRGGLMHGADYRAIN